MLTVIATHRRHHARLRSSHEANCSCAGATSDEPTRSSKCRNDCRSYSYLKQSKTVSAFLCYRWAGRFCEGHVAQPHLCASDPQTAVRIGQELRETAPLSHNHTNHHHSGTNVSSLGLTNLSWPPHGRSPSPRSRRAVRESTARTTRADGSPVKTNSQLVIDLGGQYLLKLPGECSRRPHAAPTSERGVARAKLGPIPEASPEIGPRPVRHFRGARQPQRDWPLLPSSLDISRQLTQTQQHTSYPT